MEPRGKRQTSTPDGLGNRGRAQDFLLLILSLMVLLGGYELVIGCNGEAPVPKSYTVTDGQEINNKGRPVLTPERSQALLSEHDPCVTVTLKNTVDLLPKVQCEECGMITWAVRRDNGNTVTLTPMGDITSVEICRPSDAPPDQIKRTRVQLVGPYKAKLQAGLADRTRHVSIPVIYQPR